MGFTAKQQMVVDHRRGSLLVSAAAGSGKTSTLVAHVVSRIREGGDLGRLIIVTYTKAAAGEMRERIRLELEDALSRTPQDRHLRHQLAILGQARILTIDGLCNRLVRSYFQQIDGLTPDLRIADEAEIRLLSQDVMEEVLEEAYREESPDFYALLDGYSNEKNHDEIIGQVLSLYDSSQNAPFPEDWLASALPEFPATEQALQETSWMRSAAQRLQTAVRTLGERQEALIRELEAEEAEHGAVLTQLKAEREISRSWELLTDYYPLRDALAVFRIPAFTKKEFKQDPSYDSIKAVRGGFTTGGYYQLLAPLRKPPYIEPAEELRLLALTKAPARALISLTERFAEKLGQACRERSMATFMDMEHYTLRLLMEKSESGRLVPTELARELQQGLDEIIVDEYQDINQVQEYILRGLSGEDSGHPNLFMVGDVKQSIYRFRRADPGIFMEKYASFSSDEGALHRKILLQDNFRSRAAVLESANRLFSGLMSRDFGGVDYDESVALNPAAAFPGPDPQPRILLLQSEENAATRAKEEGRLIAWSIRKLLAEKRQIREKRADGREGMRPLSWGDIVILSRSLGYGASISRVLKSYGIPAVAQENKGFYDTLEVQTLLSLLAVLDNARQDIPLAAVLLSPFGGLTQEELARDLPAALPGKDLLDRVREAAATMPGSGYDIFLQKLENWRDLAACLAVPELLDKLLSESAYELYLKAMPSGAVRLANLRQLMQMAADYEQSSYRGLHQFLRYVERQKDLEIDVGEAPLLSGGADVVRIGTLHSSKGLEYPIVFLAGLGRKFNETDLNSPVLIHAEHGLALMSSDGEARMKCGNLWRSFVAEAIRREGRAEELRLLYVGMTRAVEQLFLVGSLSTDPEEATEKQRGKAPETAGCFLDWLLQCRGAGNELGCSWEIYHPEDIPQPEAETVKEQLSRWQTDRERTDPKRLTALREQLAWQYPYTALPKLSFSVSELKHAAEETPAAVSRPPQVRMAPDEEDAEALSAAQKGTAFHKLMEHIPPEKAADREGAAAYIREALAKGIFTEAEAASLDPGAAAAFYRQPVGRRACAAAEGRRLLREKPFILGIPYRELEPESESDETVLVQGIIDLYFEEADGLILVDYKTDHVKDAAELIRRYRTQLSYYSRALAAASDKIVKEIYIYSTCLRRFIPLEPLR